jgi:uncharacterized membrane protein YbhN (UPF0104 family)
VNRQRAVGVAKWVFVLIVVAAGSVALARGWHSVGPRFGLLSRPTLVSAFLVSLLAGVGSMLCWRAILTDLGSHVSPVQSARIFFPGQLAKYVPGSIWSVVSHMELARRYGIARIRAATATAVTMVLTSLSGIVVGLATLPLTAAHQARRYALLLIAVPVLVAAVHPRVLTRLLNTALRLMRRPPLERGLGWRGASEGFAWMIAVWALYGVQVWLLATELGGSGPKLLPLSIGAFAVAWTAGFLFVVAPAGAGVREAGIVLFLAPTTGVANATVVALASRALLTLADVGLALALIPGLRRRAVPAKSFRE